VADTQAGGTANCIVPLGDAYLELVTAVDAAAAARSSFGRWVTASQSEQLRPLGWAVRTNVLDEVASRLGLTIEAGSRTGRDGELVSWRLAGVEEAAAEPALPFFIEWAPGTQLPGRARTAHATGEVSIAEVRVSGDPHHIKSWLGTHQCRSTFVQGHRRSRLSSSDPHLVTRSFWAPPIPKTAAMASHVAQAHSLKGHSRTRPDR